MCRWGLAQGVVARVLNPAGAEAAKVGEVAVVAWAVVAQWVEIWAAGEEAVVAGVVAEWKVAEGEWVVVPPR